MWASKVRYLSMIKPNNVWCDNRSIFVASRRSFKVAVSSLSLCCNFFPVTSNALVFSVLMYIFHQVDHFSIFSQLFKRARVKKSDIIPVCSQGQGGIISIFINGGVVHSPRYDRNQATLSGLAPYTDNFSSSRLWLIASNALRKSTNYTSPVTSSLSLLNKISSVILIRVVSVEWAERRADCN